MLHIELYQWCRINSPQKNAAFQVHQQKQAFSFLSSNRNRSCSRFFFSIYFRGKFRICYNHSNSSNLGSSLLPKKYLLPAGVILPIKSFVRSNKSTLLYIETTSESGSKYSVFVHIEIDNSGKGHAGHKRQIIFVICLLSSLKVISKSTSSPIFCSFDINALAHIEINHAVSFNNAGLQTVFPTRAL